MTEFFETMFCFSILVLIGQRFVMIWKKLDQKYLQTKIKQFDEESRWETKKVPNDPSFNQAQQQYRAQQENQTKQQQTNKQSPKQQNLRSSLVENDNDQTNRNIAQNDENQAQQYKRKSLTDLRKEQQLNSRQIQIKDDSDISHSRKNSFDANTANNKQLNQNDKKKSEGVEKLQFTDLNNQQPSITSNYSHPEGEFRQQIKANFNIQLFAHIDSIFSQHIPLLMSILVMGILVHSTYLFTMICFFGYIFSHLILRNAITQRHSSSESWISRLAIIIPKLWIVVIFITYWVDSQFS